MSRIYIPTRGAEDWRRLLADPKKHWRRNCSAMELAKNWEASDSFPPEIFLLFSNSEITSFKKVELLLAFPEYKVFLPGGNRPSQNDLFILAKAQDGQLIAITIEGKVSEPFGPTLGEWSLSMSKGKRRRLEFIKEQMALNEELPNDIRYQLLHRTASAVIEATRFNAPHAVMIVHSFSRDDLWFDDYQRFLALFGVDPVKDKLVFLKQNKGINLYAGWARARA